MMGPVTGTATPKQIVEQAIAEHDLDLDDYSSKATEFRASLYSPAGVVFRATGCHLLTVNYSTDRPAGWRSLAEDLAAGFEACEDPDCETCR